MIKNVPNVKMDIISWKKLMIASGKYPKDIILMKQQRLIWNVMKLVKLAQQKNKEIKIIVNYVKIIIYYILILIA